MNIAKLPLLGRANAPKNQKQIAFKGEKETERLEKSSNDCLVTLMKHPLDRFDRQTKETYLKATDEFCDAADEFSRITTSRTSSSSRKSS